MNISGYGLVLIDESTLIRASAYSFLDYYLSHLCIEAIAIVEHLLFAHQVQVSSRTIFFFFLIVQS